MFLMDSDRVRQITELVGTLADRTYSRQETEDNLTKIHGLLPDFDHPPEGQQFAEACQDAAWHAYVCAYAQKMDDESGPAPKWSDRMEAKYGAEMTRWPVPGFPAFRASIDVAQLVGQFDATQPIHFMRLCWEAYGYEYRTSGDDYLPAEKLKDALVRLVLEHAEHGASLDDCPIMQAVMVKYPMKEIHKCDEFGLDWLPHDLPDCGVPVKVDYGST